MKNFPVTYYDGESSKAYKSTLTIYESYWVIHLINEDEKVKWDLGSIISSKNQTKQMMSFSYGKYPFQYIECYDEKLLEEIKDKNKNANLYNKLDDAIHKFPVKSIVSLMFLIVAVSVSMYMYVLPTMAEKFAGSVHKKYVAEFGNYVFTILKHDLDIDAKKSEELQNFSNELTFKTEFDIQTFVVDSPEVNAFALSGGRIVVYSGLLNKIKTKEQLAALLSHEVTHIKERHVLKNLSRNLSGYLFLSVLSGDVNGVMSVLMENGHMLTNLNYSRSLEQEADENGVQTLYKNEVNPEGMIGLFEILKKESGEEESYFKYISSHPMLEQRIDYVETIIANNKDNSTKKPMLKKHFEILKND